MHADWTSIALLAALAWAGYGAGQTLRLAHGSAPDRSVSPSRQGGACDLPAAASWTVLLPIATLAASRPVTAVGASVMSVLGAHFLGVCGGLLVSPRKHVPADALRSHPYASLAVCTGCAEAAWYSAPDAAPAIASAVAAVSLLHQWLVGIGRARVAQRPGDALGIAWTLLAWTFFGAPAAAGLSAILGLADPLDAWAAFGGWILLGLGLVSFPVHLKAHLQSGDRIGTLPTYAIEFAAIILIAAAAGLLLAEHTERWLFIPSLSAISLGLACCGLLSLHTLRLARKCVPADAGD